MANSLEPTQIPGARLSFILKGGKIDKCIGSVVFSNAILIGFTFVYYQFHVNLLKIGPINGSTYITASVLAFCHRGFSFDFMSYIYRVQHLYLGKTH